VLGGREIPKAVAYDGGLKATPVEIFSKRDHRGTAFPGAIKKMYVLFLSKKHYTYLRDLPNTQV